MRIKSTHYTKNEAVRIKRKTKLEWLQANIQQKREINEKAKRPQIIKNQTNKLKTIAKQNLHS